MLLCCSKSRSQCNAPIDESYMTPPFIPIASLCENLNTRVSHCDIGGHYPFDVCLIFFLLSWKFAKSERFDCEFFLYGSCAHLQGFDIGTLFDTMGLMFGKIVASFLHSPSHLTNKPQGVIPLYHLSKC